MSKVATFVDNVLQWDVDARPEAEYPGLWYKSPANGRSLHVISEYPSRRRHRGNTERDGGHGTHGVHIGVEVQDVPATATLLRGQSYPAVHVRDGKGLNNQVFTADGDGHVWELYNFTAPGKVRHTAHPGVTGDEIVATGNRLATAAAVQILRAGGSAADAAIAANAVLSVVEPMNSGLGGSGMAFVYNPKFHAGGLAPDLFDGTGVAPGGPSLEELRRKHPDLVRPAGMPDKGPLSILVPGAARMWCDMHKRHGTLPWDALFAPAIDLAESGFPVSRHLELNYAHAREFMESDELSDASKKEFGRLFLHRSGRLLKLNDLHTNPKLGALLRRLGGGGCQEFYSGALARELVQQLQEQGSYVSEADMSAMGHRQTMSIPLRHSFVSDGDNYTMLVPAGASNGATTLAMLALVEKQGLLEPAPAPGPPASHDDPRVTHGLVEAKKAAFDLMLDYLGDKRCTKGASAAPCDCLADYPGLMLSIREASERISKTSAFVPGNERPGGAKKDSPDTVGLVVADQRGLVVSLSQSIYRPFGSGVTASGLLFTSRGNSFATAPEDHPNVYGRGKRSFTTLIPSFIYKNQKPWLAVSGKGGNRQPQALIQVLVGMLRGNMALQAAVDAPRFRHLNSGHPAHPSSPNPDWYKGGTVQFDLGAPSPGLKRRLEAMGHRLGPEPAEFADSPFGIVQAVQFREDGVRYSGASDGNRKPGMLVGTTAGHNAETPPLNILAPLSFID